MLHHAGALRPLNDARRLAGDAFERAYLEAALAASGGNVSRAADAAGVSRQLLTKLTAKHGMRAKDRDG
jgi:DNA-binding NtrC family response regulator